MNRAGAERRFVDMVVADSAVVVAARGMVSIVDALAVPIPAELTEAMVKLRTALDLADSALLHATADQ